MKILFERNERMKLDDLKIYESRETTKELDNLDNKDVFLLKDDRTNYKAFDPRYEEDIKSVFILVASKDGNFKIKIKGNLSYFGRDGQLKFYPVFIDKFGTFTEHKDFWYQLDLDKINDENLSRFDWPKQNKLIYQRFLKEFKTDKYTPPIATTEWKDFIEPYEYYVDLKFELLKQDFIMLEGFESRFSKVILVDKRHSNYVNYKENELYKELIEDNKRQNLLLDFDEYKSSFDSNYLKKNTYFLANKFDEISKDEKRDSEMNALSLNSKFKKNIDKSTFFTTEKTYTSDDLRRDGRMDKNDIELDVEFAHVKDLQEEHNIIDTKASKIHTIINNISNIESPSDLTIEKLNTILASIDKVRNHEEDFKKLLSNIQKDLNKKASIIEDEDMEYVNDVTYEIAEYSSSKLINEFSKKMNTFIDSTKLEVASINEKYSSNKKNKEIIFEKIKNEINENVKLMESKIKSLDKKDDKKDIDTIKSKVKKLKAKLKDSKKDLDKLIKELELSEIKEISSFMDSKVEIVSKFINDKVNSEINNIRESIEKVYNTVSNGIARTVSYKQNLQIVFNFKNRDDKKIKKNFYMLNTGDMVLVDTIRRINTKIKRGDEMNSDILYKIIRRVKMKKFNDKESVENDFVPKEYNNLNPSQQRAFRLAIDKTDPVSIIQGPPGTGKTEVITNIVKYFRNKGEKVILSSQTNVAIENVLDKLCSHDKVENSVIIPWLTTKSKVDYSRVNLSDTWYKKFINNVYKSKASYVDKWEAKLNELKVDDEFLKDFSLVRDAKAYAATTTTSVTLPKRGYDDHLEDVKVLIIDEVSKSILPEILRYALDVEKVILVGDYKQLNPIFDIREEDIEGKVDRTKFNKLRKEIQSGIFYNLAKDAKKVDRIATLDTNYRSVPGVLDAYNVFYQDDGSEGLKGYRQFSEYSKSYSYENSEYFDSKHSLYFFNTTGTREETRGTSRYNKGEINVLIKALWDLADSLENANEKDVAIIFPYAAQIQMFSNKMNSNENKGLRDRFKSFKWDTVDSFQGSEANIVFLSTVVTDGSKRNFLQDFRRINVSMSRAKDLLAIIGSGPVLKQLEISGEGIKADRYFSKILDDKENEYLKVIKIKELK